MTRRLLRIVAAPAIELRGAGLPVPCGALHVFEGTAVLQGGSDECSPHRVGGISPFKPDGMKETFRSMPASVNRVTEEMRVISDNGGELLRSFENELRIVQTIGAGRDSIRFTLVRSIG